MATNELAHGKTNELAHEIGLNAPMLLLQHE